MQKTISVVFLLQIEMRHHSDLILECCHYSKANVDALNVIIGVDYGSL